MELDLKDYIKIIRKRIWLIMVIVLCSCIATAVVSYMFIRPVYEASTKLIVNKSSDRIGTTVDQLNINDINLNIRLIDTYKEIIKTPAIMEKVVAQYPGLSLTVNELIAKVRVSSVNNTQVMTLIVQDESYNKAAEIVNAVSKVFQSEITKIYKVDNVSMLNEAKPMDNPSPVKPNPKLNIAISLIVSLMAAIGIAFLLEYLDDTIKSEADVQKVLGLPTLAMISKIKEEDITAHQPSTPKARVGERTNASTTSAN
ncbi:YveK family protein [Paenibacillus sp. HJGM_3]|uniref:YveK family protein n=1 Tax=Paenibacillus sp. HJGM_3 TaxID=3379816 RepID=UPI00385EE1FF